MNIFLQQTKTKLLETGSHIVIKASCAYFLSKPVTEIVSIVLTLL